MKVVAITRPGSEYLYRSSSAHQVPVSSALKIVNALNAARYGLKEGEIWNLYDVDQYSAPVWQCFRIRSGYLYEGSI